MSKHHLQIIDGSNIDAKGHRHQHSHAILRADQVPQTNWGAALVGIPFEWQITQGEGIRIMLFDTGVDATHPDLSRNFAYGFDLTRGGSQLIPRNTCADRDGHGTHCSGIAYANGQITGVAPLAEGYMVKILGDDGSGDTEWICQAAEYAIRSNVDVVSMSLGTHTQPTDNVLNAIRRMIAQNICVVVAAGNEGTEYSGDSVGWPAKYVNEVPDIIVVTAVDRNSQRPSWSSSGGETTIAAPGVDVYSTFLNHGYSVLSGTSMATPFVAGTVALMLSHHRKSTELKAALTPHDVKRLLIEHARHTNGVVGHTDQYGFGVVDHSAIEAAEHKHEEE